MKIAYLDGRRLYRVLYAGIQNILDHQDYLNKINVFPVPDGDTGTNMAYTLMGIAERMRTHLALPLGELSQQVANAAIDNARGNSGAILAQFFQGFAEAVSGKAKLSTTQFADAVSVASQSAYQALAHPREGTILSVIKTWSICLKDKAQHYRDYLHLMETSLNEAKRALSKTPDQLPVLKKAGVVDAAGQGFVDILEGMFHFMQHGNLRQTIKVDQIPIEPTEGDDIHSEDLNLDFPFCTEGVVAGSELDRRALMQHLEQLGDSIVVAGSPEHLKIHLHTNEPGVVFNHLRSLGQLSQQKVDDMRVQHRAAADPKSIALVVDSTCDLPPEVYDRFHIHTVPVRLNFGEQEYIDKITISGEEFYQRLLTDKNHPKTSQPPLGDVKRVFNFLSSHYSSIISINVPHNSSGTMQGIEAGLKEVEFKHKAVIDGLSLSIGTGLSVIAAGEAIEAGESFETVVECTKAAVQKTEVFIGLDSMDAVFRGGRVSDKKKKVVEALHLNPILTMSKEGFVVSAGVTFGRRNKFQKLTRFVMKKVGNRRIKRIGIVHAVNPDAAAETAKIFAQKYPGVELYQSTVGPALGVHAGRKALGIAVQFV